MTHKIFNWPIVTLFLIVGSLPILSRAQVAKFGGTIEEGTYESYLAQDGTQYNVGDKLKLGLAKSGNRTFSFINMHPGGMIFGGVAPCPATCAGLEYEIVEFKQGRNGEGANMWAKMKAPDAFTGPITVNFENALQSGELVGRGYTSDQAMQELKKWKEKLDLELITRGEYESKKEELSKYIH